MKARDGTGRTSQRHKPTWRTAWRRDEGSNLVPWLQCSRDIYTERPGFCWWQQRLSGAGQRQEALVKANMNHTPQQATLRKQTLQEADYRRHESLTRLHVRSGGQTWLQQVYTTQGSPGSFSLGSLRYYDQQY